MYYCKSRYYNPSWCRWVTSDSIKYLEPKSINGLNLYGYCKNDSVNKHDPNGCWALPAWSKVIIGIFCPFGASIIGANAAYESSKTLGKSKEETFFWTLSGIFIGNFGVVEANWDEVKIQSNFGYRENDGYCNFDFSKNPHYSLWTSFIYSRYLEENYCNNDCSRSVSGLDVELLVHYLLYAFGNYHGKNGSWMQTFEPSLSGVKEEFDAVLFEVIGLVLNPIFYFYR